MGRGIGRPLLESTDDDVDAMIRDNMKSVLYGMQVVTPHLQARGTGAIVNVSSLLGRTPLPPRAAYAAAKAAMMSLSEAFRIELAGSHPNIRVAALSGRGDVYTQPNALARVREYMEKQPG